MIFYSDLGKNLRALDYLGTDKPKCTLDARNVVEISGRDIRWRWISPTSCSAATWTLLHISRQVPTGRSSTVARTQRGSTSTVQLSTLSTPGMQLCGCLICFAVDLRLDQKRPRLRLRSRASPSMYKAKLSYTIYLARSGHRHVGRRKPAALKRWFINVAGEVDRHHACRMPS